MGTLTFDAEAATPPLEPVARGGSRYAKIPADWPKDARVRVLLLPNLHKRTGEP